MVSGLRFDNLSTQDFNVTKKAVDGEDYQEVQGLSIRSVPDRGTQEGPLLWRDDRWEEMLMVTLFVPLLAVNLTSAFDSILTSTDASDTRLGASDARAISIFPSRAQDCALVEYSSGVLCVCQKRDLSVKCSTEPLCTGWKYTVNYTCHRFP